MLASALERFFELSPDLLCLLDGDAAIVRVNAAFQRLHGRSSTEFVGRPFAHLAHADDRLLTTRAVDGLTADAGSVDFTNRVRDASGEYRPIHWTALRDGQSGLTMLVGQDRSAARANGVLGELISSGPDMVAVVDAELTVRIANAAVQRVLGFAPSEMVGRPLSEVVWSEDADVFDSVTAQVLSAPGASVAWQVRARHADGGFRWLEGTSTNRLNDATANAIVISCHDVTERKLVELALGESEERLRQAIRMSSIGIFDKDHVRDTLYWSPRQREIHGVGAEEPFSTAEFLRLVHPDDRGWLEEAVRKAHDPRGDGLFDEVYRIVRRDGQVRWMKAHSQTFFQGDGTARHPVRTVGAVADDTERRAGEEALRESELKLRTFAQNAQAVIFILDRTGTFVLSEGQALRVLGLAPGEVVGRSALEMYADVPSIGTAIRQALAGEFVRTTSVVGETWFDTVYSPYLAADGTVDGVVGVAIDITERYRAEDALRLRDQAISSALIGIAMTDADGRVTYVNPAFLRMWGAAEPDVLGKTPVEFMDVDAVGLLRQQLEATGRCQGEVVARRADGSTFDVLLTGHDVRDEHGRLTSVVGSFLDITERKRMQAQFLQAQKMESVGRLAGGVAHDFNNLLTVIKGHLDLAQDQVDPRDPLFTHLQAVSRAADSATAVTQQLLAFSRKQIIDPRILDLNAVLQHVERMLGRLLGEDIDVQTIAAPGLGRVRFDRAQAEQILINLAVNARDAMPDGGKLTIETANVLLGDDYVLRHPGSTPGAYVMLTVTDTGAGMTEEVQSHLFEPFFTTKQAGHGTGLGLAMVYGAVTQNGGVIEVSSEVGRGTCFKIYLPRVLAHRETAVPKHELSVARGSEAIVLVEDDEDVRGYATLVLSRQGYRVYAHADGHSAIRAVEHLSEAPALLVTDVIMPDMNGKTLADRLTVRCPDLRVLFTSGYTENVIAHHGVLEPGVEFLQKPYSVEALVSRVREVLDTPRT